jgi:hypothetical protein
MDQHLYKQIFNKVCALPYSHIILYIINLLQKHIDVKKPA